MRKQRVKHSKVRNTGLLFEFLLRQITADVLDKKSGTAIKIVKEYFNEKTNKTQIVLHHTATDNIGRGSKAEVEAIMKYWRNDISPPNTPYPAVSTHWIADREGNGVKVMDYIYWSRNSGVGDSTAKNQLSVELCSSGWLEK